MNRVVNTYVRALYGAAVEQNVDAKGFADLESNLMRLSGAVIQSDDLRGILRSPTVTSEEKLGILKKIIVENSSSKLLEIFLGLLTQKGRLALVESLGDAFSKVRLEAQGAVLGLAESAEPLKDSDIQELSESFEKNLGKKVHFKTKIDPNLLAGVKVTVNGVTYDGTVRAQLNQLRDQMSLSKI
jgi:F-type H+-transporting ATPase subunit delta